MIDYNSWKRIKLKPTNLKLDDENLRLTGFDKNPKERDIIHYMIENEKIAQLAKSIAQKGYFPNEDPIVFKEKNRYVVVEGNRRVTACKLLIQPSIAPKNRIKTFEKIANGFNLELIRSLYCRVAPTKDDADILIENRHTNVEIEKWDRIKQYRFYYLKFKDGKSIEYIADRYKRSVGDMAKMVRRYEMFEIAKKLDLDEITSEALANESKLDITNLERFYENRHGKTFLGLTFQQDGTINYSIPKEEFNKRYKRIVEDFTNGELNSRNFGNSDEQSEAYIKNIFESDNSFDLSIVLKEDHTQVDKEVESESNEEDSSGSSTAEGPAKKRQSGNSSATIIPKSWVCNTDIERINRICDELQKLTLGSKPNASLVLFRSFLEMVTYQFLHSNNVILEVKKLKGVEHENDFKKRQEKVRDYLINDLKIAESLIKNNKLKKVVTKVNLPKDWTPSLYRMLTYLANQDTNLIKDPKMKEGLHQYLKVKGDILTHNDFNLYVHNEYSVSPLPKEINEQWSGIKPLLKYMLRELDIHNQSNNDNN